MRAVFETRTALGRWAVDQLLEALDREEQAAREYAKEIESVSRIGAGLKMS